MLSRYGALFKVPGTISFSASAFVARFPMAMLGLAIVIFVESSLGNYSTAGALSAALLIATSLAAPVQARVADRVGQTRLVVPLLAVHTVAMLTFVIVVRSEGPVLLAATAVVAAGASLPQFGAFVRRRWSHVLSTPTPPASVGVDATVDTAYAWESILDEVVFISGPVLVAMLALGVDPAVAVLSTLGFTVLGGVAYAACRATEPGGREPGTPRTEAGMPWVAMSLLAASALALGVTFGAIELSTVAHTDQIGRPATAAVVLSAFAAGSLAAGVVAGARTWRSSTLSRYPIGAAALAVALTPALVAREPFVLAGVMALAGLTVSPTLISGYSLVQELIPADRLTEGLAYYQTALGLGVALGAAVTGPIADTGRASWGFGVAMAGGAAASAFAFLLMRRTTNVAGDLQGSTTAS